MATTRPEFGASLLLPLAMLAWASPASAQTATTTPTTQVQPSVDLRVTATNNANASTGGPARKDVIVDATAAVAINAKGANTKVAGQWRMTSVNYLRNSQPDRILPSGLIDLHTDLYRKEGGLDASVSSEQVASSFGTTPGDNNTAATTTNTRLSLSPYFYRQLDNDASVLARLKRTWVNTSANGDSTDPDHHGTEDDHVLRWEKRPARLGYALEGTYSKSPIFAAAGSGLPDTALTRKAVTATLLYALTPEFAAGPIVGRESSQLENTRFSGQVSGVQMQWRPNERTWLKVITKHSVFGREWTVDASRKTSWTTFSLTSRRAAETYTSQALPGTPKNASDLGAVAREATSGRMSFMGRRDTINLTAGLIRATPLVEGNGSPTPRTREYFFETELTHRLTRLSNLTGGLRWTRSVSTDINTHVATPSREFTARLGVDTKLSPDTTANMGLKRQITHNPATTTNGESAMFVGLGHRF